MAAGADLYALLGPMTDEQVRKVVTILRLGPGQVRRSETAEKPPAETEHKAA